MAQKSVTLNPGESVVVSFQVIPHEAGEYQVSVNGLTGSFVAVAPPFYWLLPTGHIAHGWDDAELAYDSLIDTRARFTITPQCWSPCFELFITPTEVYAIRWWASHQTSILQPTRKFPTQVDVYYINGTWHNVYDGNKAVMWDSGLNIPEGSQIISRARIRVYNESTTLNKRLGLNEFQFWGSR